MIEHSSYLQDICEIISSLFNIVITVVDKNYLRISGTHNYKPLIGKPADNPYVFKKIMEEENTIIVKNPGEDDICNECKNKNSCIEKAAIYTPLRVDEKVVGAVGLIAFTEDQKNSGVFNNTIFFKFTEKLGELLSSKIEAQEYEKKLNINLKENLAILNSVHDGVVAINQDGYIYQINSSASVYFGITKDKFINKHISSIFSKYVVDKIKREKSFVDIEDKVVIGNVKTSVLITSKTIEENGSIYGTVLIIKSMKEANSIARKLIHGADYMVNFCDIIGNSPEIENIKNLSKKIAKSDSTILIRGESGTGKEMFARAIHNDSTRKRGPFIAVNCAAIPEPLLESELFGYEDGSFTGAKKGGKIGKCELAIGGTLFLDEVGDIPLFLQSKFLRMLQERAIERVGGNKNIPVDIRIIAATNRDLEKMIRNNEYREDLYYRLNVIPIFLPPLRQRKSDIPVVSRHFLSKYANKLGKQITEFSQEALNALNLYDWPGNLRELENAIECAVNIESECILTLNSFPEKIKRYFLYENNKHQNNSIEFNEKPIITESNLNNKSIRKTSIDDVIAALDKYGWDTIGKKNASKSLGIGIATLYRILNDKNYH